MKVRDVLSLIEERFEPSLAETDDPIGLLIGDPDDDVTGIAISLDVTLEVVAEAVRRGANCVIAHHPLIYRPMATIRADSGAGRIVLEAIRAGISVIAAHTNVDWAAGGLNDHLAALIGLANVRPLWPRAPREFRKIVVFVPPQAEDAVADAMFAAGAGEIGAYRKCSFRLTGTGTFVPQEGADPFNGKVGELSRENETRLEVLVANERTPAVVRAMIDAHPYEEVAYDVYPLAAEGNVHGVARIGDLAEPASPAEIARRLKYALGLEQVRAAGPDREVRRVAVCTGGGAFLIPRIPNDGETLFVSGDFKFHDARHAEQLDLPVLDISHIGAEMPFVDIVGDFLRESFAGLKGAPAVHPLRVEKEPFRLL
ncbi:Nif3-like dinuclear metal center hexameric protein [bacterium]|nr:Nif3-like dinuclear metal center hexameric protein [bacterium]